MTVTEFQQLRDLSESFEYELRHGQLFQVTRPRSRHYQMQRSLRDLLLPHAEPGSLVDIELAFRPLPEYELRVADVAYVSASRVAEIDPDDYLRGAPELVVEILSLSNTALEMLEKEQICLQNGCREFWIIDPQYRLVKVSAPRRLTTTYREGQHIPIALFGDAKLFLDDLF